MKIVLASTFVPFINGGARFIVEWLQEQLLAHGHEVDVVFWMEVGDEDGVEVPRVEPRAEWREGSVAKVEDDPTAATLDDVAGRGPAAAAGIRGTGPDDHET